MIDVEITKTCLEIAQCSSIGSKQCQSTDIVDMKITVIVCTFNRSAYLPELLASLSGQTLPSSEFEVIVVDNNSSDDTKVVTRSYFGRGMNLRYVLETEQGLSAARNRGLRESRAPLVAYIDDDACASAGWLEAIVSAFADEKVSCVGGPVSLDWQGERPAWLPVQYESLYTSVDHGDEQRTLTPHEYLVGANIAFRRDWLVSVGGFSIELGRKGNCLLSGEEARVFQSVFATGRQAVYDPTASVRHRVTSERKNRWWLSRRLFWDGATQPILDTGIGQCRAVYMGEAYKDIRRCFRFTVDTVLALVRSDREMAIVAGARLIQRLGRCWMHLRLAAGRTP